MTYLTDGPGCGRLDVMFSLLGETQGQLGHPLQERRTHDAGEAYDDLHTGPGGGGGPASGFSGLEE